MRNTSCWTWLQLDRIGLSLDYHGLRHMTQLFNGALVTFNSTRHTVISTVYHSHMMYLPGHLSLPLLMWMSRSLLCEIHLMHNSLLAAHRTAQVGTSIPRRTPQFQLASMLLSTPESPCSYLPGPMVELHHGVAWLGNRVLPQELEL